MPLFLDSIASPDPRFVVSLSTSGPQHSADGTADALAPNCAGLAANIIAVRSRSNASHQMREHSARPYNSFIERMLADPLIRLVMEADGVSETEIRSLYRNVMSTAQQSPAPAFRYQASTYFPLPEASPCPGSPRPGIGE